MHNTHTPRIGQPISIDAPTLLFTAKSINTTQTYPSVTLAAASPKPKKVHYKNQVTAFQHYKINFKKSLSLPYRYGNRLVIDHHKTAHDQVFWRLHWLFSFLLSQDSSVHFFAQIRIATFWAITACCHLQICVHVIMSMQLDLEMCGIASRASLGCCCAVFGTN